MIHHGKMKTIPPGKKTADEARDSRVNLIDALDVLIEKGVVVNGDIAIRVADVDLIYLGLRLLVTSVSKAEELSGRNFSDNGRRPTAQECADIAKLERQIKEIEQKIPQLIDVGTSEKAEQGLAKLVFILVELIRKLLEREAMRRMHGGTLADIEVQKLGMTFKALDRKMEELKGVFGIKDEELNLDLGPLGQLL